jgi:HNH endonuclease
MSLRLEAEEYHALWMSVLERDGWRCRNTQCGMRNNLHVHHIIFRSELGPDESWNLVTLCSDCHDAVHAYKLFIGCYSLNFVGPGGGADGKLIFTGGYHSHNSGT